MTNYSFVVELLYKFVESKKSSEDFDLEFGKILKEFSLSQDIPAWLVHLFNIFEQTKEHADIENSDSIFVTSGEFLYEIMKTLQELKNSGKYTDIILNDYSKYV